MGLDVNSRFFEMSNANNATYILSKRVTFSRKKIKK